VLFIPAVDLIDGRCVRLAQGDYGQETRYDRDPVETAVWFQDEGARYLHVVDLDAARDPDRHNRATIQRMIEVLEIPVEVGGGVRDQEGVKALLDIGVSRVILGTLIVKNEALAGELISRFGSQLVAGIDARNGIVRISGWTEGSSLTAGELGKRVRDMGFELLIYTDIARDGMLDGPNIEGIRAMAVETGLPILAAGGISTLQDLERMKSLEHDGVRGVISGKAIYEGRFSPREAIRLLQGGSAENQPC
jgi:phosphoribosylformimino-5-aminoimidazole carboxamide ribotide isomerase